MFIRKFIILIGLLKNILLFDLENLDFEDLSQNLENQFENFDVDQFGQLWASLGKIYLLGLSCQKTNYGKAYVYFNVATYYGNAEGQYFKFFMNRNNMSPFNRSRYKYFDKPLKKLKEKKFNFVEEEKEILITQEFLDEIVKTNPEMKERVQSMSNLIGTSIKVQTIDLGQEISANQKESVSQKALNHKQTVQKIRLKETKFSINFKKFGKRLTRRTLRLVEFIQFKKLSSCRSKFSIILRQTGMSVKIISLIQLVAVAQLKT